MISHFIVRIMRRESEKERRTKEKVNPVYAGVMTAALDKRAKNIFTKEKNVK